MTTTNYRPQVTTAARRITRTMNRAADYEIVFFDTDGETIASMNRQDRRWHEGRLGFDYALALTTKPHGEKWSQVEAQVWLDSLAQDDPEVWRYLVFSRMDYENN